MGRSSIQSHPVTTAHVTESDMHERAFRRALALGAASLLLITTGALADTVGPSSDGVTPAIGGIIDLGTVGPGAALSRDVAFVVSCSGSTHLQSGATVSLSPFTAGPPPGGSINESAASVGPAPSGWAASGCTSPAQTFTGGTPSHIALTAPNAPSPPGQPYEYSVVYRASTSTGAGLASSFVGLTLLVAVSGDQPPVLQLPADMTVEGDTQGGATVTYTATATDAEDSQAPVVACLPASGSLFALGPTTVTCSATDSVGQTSTGSFTVTVVDTTPPTLAQPADLTVTTYDPSGAVVTYPLPTATDVVDPSPTVACTPAPGSLFPPGETTVTCTAADHSGNEATAAFEVDVNLVRLGAVFEAPIGPSDLLAINPGRTLPVKVAVTADGVPLSTAAVTLALVACGGGSLGSPIALAYVEGRWFVGLDTSGLSGCTTGTLLWDGHPAASFTMTAPSASPATPRRHR